MKKKALKTPQTSCAKNNKTLALFCHFLIGIKKLTQSLQMQIYTQSQINEPYIFVSPIFPPFFLRVLITELVLNPRFMLSLNHVNNNLVMLISLYEE